MRRLFLLLGIVGVLGMVSGSSAATHVAAGWGSAVEVPGTATLNSGGDGWVNSVSCANAGDCTAVGIYRDGSSHHQAFVVSEKNSVWGNAVEVPGTAALDSGRSASVGSISCAKAGDCAAGGSYVDGSGLYQAFVVSEKNGVWGNAVEVPGTATLNSGGNAYANSVSCAAPGDCAAGGYYLDGSGHYQVFVVSEKNGVWGNAVEVPGTATLNSGDDARVNSVSCAKAGDCTAGGSYLDGSSHYQAFVVREKNGVWGNAVEVPGTATLNSGGEAGVASVSCGKAGECTAGGSYLDGSSHYQVFVVRETNGAWGKAVEVPGTATLNSGGNAYVNTVSCAAPDDCAAGGYYKDGSTHLQVFVVSETNGVWGKAIEVPGTATLNNAGNARVYSVSCAGAGTCTAGGYYQDGSSHYHAFVVSETNGAWGKAVEVPGTATLNSGGNAQLYSVSCAKTGTCAAGGYYKDGSSHFQAFVADYTAPCIVPHLVGKTLGTAKKALAADYCGLGKVKKAYASAKKGHVVAQHPKPGRHLKHGAKVALTLSKGAKK